MSSTTCMVEMTDSSASRVSALIDMSNIQVGHARDLVPLASDLFGGFNLCFLEFKVVQDQ